MWRISLAAADRALHQARLCPSLTLYSVPLLPKCHPLVAAAEVYARLFLSLKPLSSRARRLPATKRRNRYRRPFVDGLERRELLSLVDVSGEANIYGAGLTAPPDPGGGGGGVLPVELKLSSLGNPQVLVFPAVSGTVSGWAAEGGFNGPDGGPYWGGVTNVPEYGGISGLEDDQATMFLVGVFLGPSGQPATPPATLNVTNANNIASFSPLIGQQFFIGDGRISTQDLQKFNVPTGATRLFLGFTENYQFSHPDRLPGYYGDNGGSLTVDVEGVPNMTVALPTLTALTASTASAVSGQSVTFAATVSDLSAYAVAPDGGTVTFSNQNGVLGNAMLVDGAASFTTTSLPAGTNTVTASYGGSASFAASSTGTIVTAAGNGSAGSGGNNGPATGAQLNSPQGLAIDSAGDVFIADYSNNVVREVVKATGEIITVAGDGTAGSNGDGGLANSAELNGPRGLAVDSAGDLFIADTNNNKIREVVKATGDIMTYAGTGSAGSGGDGGLAINAALNSPRGIAIDFAGDLFIADNLNNKIREVVAATGDIITVAGNGAAGYGGDGGLAIHATLDEPNGVAVDPAGDLFIVDDASNVVREVFSASGEIITVAGDGTAGYSGDGEPAAEAKLNAPVGVALDAAGDLFIADGGNNVVREVIAATGEIITVAGDGTAGYNGDNIPATAAELDGPNRVSVDSAGDLYISDNNNQRIREVTPAVTVDVSASTALPTLTALVASTASAGFGQSVTFTVTVSDSSAGGQIPSGGTVTLSDQYGVINSQTLADGTVSFTSSSLSDGTYSITASYGDSADFAPSATGAIVTAAGNGTFGYAGDNGPATAAELNGPFGLAIDSTGDVFIADYQNNVVRELVKSSGDIITVAGDGIAGYSGDNEPATAAELNGPRGLAVDSIGDLFISDSNNNVVREVVEETGDIITVAGDGAAGYSGNGGPAIAAELDGPRGLAVDSSGNLFITDDLNNRIREVVKSTGDIFTVAGNGTAGDSGDGQLATTAELDQPNGVAVDLAGDLFIVDDASNVVREVVHSTGDITTVAGDGTAGYRGDGGPATDAELNQPNGVAVDAAGDLFIADYGNNVVREVVAATGNIVTAAGNGTGGYSGDGGLATAAELNNPSRVAVDSAGDVFIADNHNDVVREITPIITVTIGQATPAITWASPADITYGTAVGSAQLDATASVAGTFSYMPSAGTILGAGNNHTLTATFTPTDTTDYSRATSSVTINVDQAAPDVSVNPVNLTYGTPLSNSQLTGTATWTVGGDVVNVPGSFAYTSAAGTVLSTGAGQSESVTFAPADSTDYESVTTSVIINVAHAMPIVSVNPVNLNYGTPLANSQLSGTATWTVGGDVVNVPGSFSYTSATGTVLEVGDGQTESVTFTPTDTTDYSSATGSVTVNVVQTGGLAVNVDPVDLTYGTPLANSQLTGTATTTVDGNVVTVPGSFSYTSAAGMVLSAGVGQSEAVTFTPSDTTDYSSTSATVTVSVDQAAPDVSVNSVNLTYGTPLSNSQLTGTAAWTVGGDVVNVPGSFAYTSAAGTVLSTGDGQSESVTFTPTDSTDYVAVAAPMAIDISPASLTITADNQSKTYGSAFTFAGTEFTTSGLVNGDTVTSVTLTSAGAAATADVAGSPYEIAPSAAVGIGMGNYSITYNAGALTVNPAPLSITANDASRAVGQANPTFTAQYSGFVLGQGPTVLSGTLAFSTSGTAGSPAGQYPIVPSGLNSANYAITFINGTLTVTGATSTSYTFVNPAGGDWDVASNWSPASIPTNGASVDIPSLSGDAEVNLLPMDTAATLSSLTVDGTLYLGNEITVPNIILNGNIDLSGNGELNQGSAAAAGALSGMGTLVLDGGELMNATVASSVSLLGNSVTLDRVTVQGNMTLQGVGASLGVQDGLALGGTITLNSNGPELSLFGSQSVTGNGSIVFAGSSGGQAYLGAVGGTATIGAGITVQFQAGMTADITGELSDTGVPGNIVDQGTVNLDGGVDTLGLSTSTNFSIDSGGRLSLLNGTSGGATDDLTNAGTLTLSPRSTFNAGNYYSQTSTGTLTVQIAAASEPLNVNQGAPLVAGSGYLAGTLNAAFVNGFSPSPGQSFTIAALDYPINGTFGTVNGGVASYPASTKVVVTIPGLDLPDIVMDMATTTDQTTVTATYNINGAPIDQPLTFAIYRSVSDMSYSQSDLIGTDTLSSTDVSDLSAGHHQVTLGLSNGELLPDPLHEYVIVVANPSKSIQEQNYSNDTAYFRIFVLGAISHGYIPPTEEVLGQTPPWEVTMQQSLITIDHYNDVIAFNWVKNSRTKAPGLASAAGQELADDIVTAATQLTGKHSGDVVDLHLIGHSRGAVVISQAAEDLQYMLLATPADRAILGSYIKMTMLDPHPATNLRGKAFYSVAKDKPARAVLALYLHFQDIADDPLPYVPSIVTSAEVFSQHTPVSKLTDKSALGEKTLNLWGFTQHDDEIGDGSSSPIKWINLTSKHFPGIGYIGHSEVYMYYKKYVVSLGTAITA